MTNEEYLKQEARLAVASRTLQAATLICGPELTRIIGDSGRSRNPKAFEGLPEFRDVGYHLTNLIADARTTFRTVRADRVTMDQRPIIERRLEASRTTAQGSFKNGRSQWSVMVGIGPREDADSRFSCKRKSDRAYDFEFIVTADWKRRVYDLLGKTGWVDEAFVTHIGKPMTFTTGVRTYEVAAIAKQGKGWTHAPDWFLCITPPGTDKVIAACGEDLGMVKNRINRRIREAVDKRLSLG